MAILDLALEDALLFLQIVGVVSGTLFAPFFVSTDQTVRYLLFAFLVSANGNASVPLMSLKAFIADTRIVVGAFSAIDILAGRALAQTGQLIDFVAVIADVTYEGSFCFTSLALPNSALRIDAAHDAWLRFVQIVARQANIAVLSATVRAALAVLDGAVEAYLII